MGKFSFEDIGSVVATFAADAGVTGGQVVKLTGNGAVGPCSGGDKFCGVALEPRRGGAAVQVKGFAEVSVTGELAVGWAVLTADGTGGVKAAPSGADGAAPDGVAALVVDVSRDGTAVLCL